MSLPRRRWVWLSVSGLLAVGVAGALTWVVFASSVLAVRDIEVAGQQRLTEPAVRQAAGVQRGVPLAKVDLDAVRARVGKMRVVESVRVSRAWPSTLRIEVQERSAVAAVPRGSGYLLLDKDGVRIATMGKPPDGLPLVRIRSGAPSSRAPSARVPSNRPPSSRAPSTHVPSTHAPSARTPGARTLPARTPAARASTTGTASAATRRAALHVVSALPNALAGKVQTVSVSADRRVRLHLREGATVVWGKPERGQEKVRILRALLRQEDASTYDVSSPEVVTTS